MLWTSCFKKKSKVGTRIVVGCCEMWVLALPRLVITTSIYGF